ncbi:hypothetical protein F66182_10003 [Fusarium sp. NRRL 66182]|nr:hypothetical protein F66182_10003 [Fusarium sp. NRRL 66182]
MPGYNDYDDDDYYHSNGCCIGCCRAGDFGTHDGCGPCDCRRSFKPDCDRTIYPGWSLGHYYPGKDEASSAVADKPKPSEKLSDSNKKQKASGKVFEQVNKFDETSKASKNLKADKISKSSKTSSNAEKQ